MYIIAHKILFLLIAAVIVGVSLLTVLLLGLKPGIDFTGGSLMEVRYGTMPAEEQVEAVVTPLALGSFSVRQSVSEAGDGYLVTTKDLAESERAALQSALTSLSDDSELVRFTSIGPVVGEELREKSVWAIGAVLMLIIVYVAIAFAGIGTPVSSWIYGLMTITVLAHDILVPLAFMSVMGYFANAEVDILFITALLTILGFSVNDTIVIFDRVREKLKQNRTESVVVVEEPGGITRKDVTYTLTKPFGDIVGMAITETISRSINTSLVVLLALAALFIFGSSVTQMFILTLIVGVVAGAYSSIFIASPLLVLYEEKRRVKVANEEEK